MNKKRIKYIIGIVVLMMVSVLALGGCKKNRDKDKETSGVEGGLQVEETGEGDSIDFEDFYSEDDDTDDTSSNETTTDGSNSNGTTTDSSNSNGTTTDSPNGNGTTTDDSNNNTEEGSGDEESGDGETDDGISDDDETGWSPFF